MVPQPAGAFEIKMETQMHMTPLEFALAFALGCLLSLLFGFAVGRICKWVSTPWRY
jgi:hypothetical protein